MRRLISFTKGLAAGVLRRSRVSQLVVHVNDRCNARCAYCFNTELPHLGGSRKNPRLTLAEHEKIAAGFPGLFQLVLSGGEPFLRDDLHRLVEIYYRVSGARLFSIPTNGSLPGPALLQVRAMLERCPKATINLIVSIDAAGARHDELRGLPGGFEKALALCREALALKEEHPNLNLVVSSVLCEDTRGELAALKKVLARELPPGWLHNVQADSRLGASSVETEAQGGGFLTKLYVDRVNAVISRQISIGRMLYRCVAGEKLAVLMPDGRVSPCEPFVFERQYAHQPSFNLREHGWRYDAVRELPAFQNMRASIERGDCAACPWSCAATASMTYEPRNWRLWLTSGKNS